MSHFICERYFNEKEVFTSAEFKAYLDECAPQRAHRHAAILYYYKTKNRLSQIRKGLYAPVDGDAARRTDPVIESFLLTSKMTPDAVLSYHTALEFHGCGYSIWFHNMYSSRRPLKPMRRRDCLIKGTTFPRALSAEGAEYVETKVYTGPRHSIRATTLERTLVDILDRPYLCGDWDEVGFGYEFAEHVGGVDVERIVTYALRLQNAFTVAKVGFFLDLYQEELGVRPWHMQALLECKPRQPRYLDNRHHRKCTLISKWNLIAPLWVQEREWDAS